MFTDFAKAAAIRALRTAAQTALGIVPSSAVFLDAVNWTQVVSASVLAAVLSLLTSVATGLPEAEDSL